MAIWRVYIGDAIGRVGHLELGRGLIGEGASLRGAGDSGGGGGGGGLTRRTCRVEAAGGAGGDGTREGACLHGAGGDGEDDLDGADGSWIGCARRVVAA